LEETTEKTSNIEDNIQDLTGMLKKVNDINNQIIQKTEKIHEMASKSSSGEKDRQCPERDTVTCSINNISNKAATPFVQVHVKRLRKGYNRPRLPEQ
jgi:hypothetical protein